MSGETILIEQLRADVERLELDLAAVAMCDSSDCGLCVSCLVSRAEKAERERDEARAERDARPDIATLPTEYVCGEWIMSGQAEPDAVVTYTREPGPETGHVGWCWWARGKMGESRDYMAARDAAEHSLIAHAAKAERERDEERHLADVRGEMLTKTERERDEARAERDARPDISAEDARAFMMFKPVPARDSREGPVMHALRAHAAKVVNP